MVTQTYTEIPKIFRNKTKASDLDIPPSLVHDIILRIMFNEGTVTFGSMVETIKIDQNLLDEMIHWLQSEHAVEVARAGTFGRLSYSYKLTEEGENRALKALERSQYIGPAPVSVEAYNEAILLQSKSLRVRAIPRKKLREVLQQLILPEGFDRRIGPALHRGASLFLYGPPGNGKTTIAQMIGSSLSDSDSLYLPYALAIGGQLIKIHDPLTHFPADDKPIYVYDGTEPTDPRWGWFKRPFVMTGGELTLDALDLRYDPIRKYYEAPVQMKANGGMLLIDDFGRQRSGTNELFNRMVVPLESKVDFFRLHSGQSFEIPLRQLMVFSTNINPMDLMDEAFLRRLQVKVLVDSPDEDLYRRIFLMYCEMFEITFDEETYEHLLDKWYRSTGRLKQGAHPRDLLSTIVAICNYADETPHLTPTLIDEACFTYFVQE